MSDADALGSVLIHGQAMEDLAEVRAQQIVDLTEELAAAQAVIAEAKRSLDYGGERHYLERIYATQNAMSQSPSDVLRRRDAEKWDEGHGAPCDQWVDSDMCREYHPNPYRKGETNE